MRRSAMLMLAGLVAVTLGACRDSSVVDLEPPATKVPIEGTDRYRVTLTPQAEVRLGIQLTDVVESEGFYSVTSDALILDTEGSFWVYVNPEPYVYERVKLESLREVDGEAHFTEGPAPGTPVVIVGVAELYGEETGVGK